MTSVVRCWHGETDHAKRVADTETEELRPREGKGGGYESASEVIREGLRALQEREAAADEAYWQTVREKVVVARRQLAEGRGLPDYVQYKWKGDQYLGYDWRKPAAKAGYERHERQKAYWRAYHKARNAQRPSRGGGSMQFRGWMWLCPICGKWKKVIYLPLSPVNVLRGYGCLREDEVIDAAAASA